MTLPELRERLAELDEEKAAISDELHAVEDATEAARRLEAARYALVHGEWFEDPNAVQPHEYLSAAASSQEAIRQAYNGFGARFTVNEEGVLGMTLSLDLEGVEKSLQEKRTF